MHGDTADVVRVGFEVCDFLRGVVVEDAELEVVAAADDPVFAGDEAACAHGHVGEFEGFDDAAGFEGPDVGVAAVEGGEDPCCVLSVSIVFCLDEEGGEGRTLGGVEVDAFDSFAAGEELSLYVEPDVSLTSAAWWWIHCCMEMVASQSSTAAVEVVMLHKIPPAACIRPPKLVYAPSRPTSSCL